MILYNKSAQIKKKQKTKMNPDKNSLLMYIEKQPHVLRLIIGGLD